jgi:hypothetical protein
MAIALAALVLLFAHEWSDIARINDLQSQLQESRYNYAAMSKGAACLEATLVALNHGFPPPYDYSSRCYEPINP